MPTRKYQLHLDFCLSTSAVLNSHFCKIERKSLFLINLRKSKILKPFSFQQKGRNMEFKKIKIGKPLVHSRSVECTREMLELSENIEQKFYKK